MAAYYSSVLQSLTKQIASCYDEITKIKAELATGVKSDNIQVNQANLNVLENKLTEIDSKLSSLDDKLSNQIDRIRNERLASETTMMTKLEQYASNNIKNRIELSIQNLKLQLVNDLTQNIKSQILSEMDVKEQTILSNAAQDVEVVDDVPPASLDLEALTKDISAVGISESNDTSEISFNTGKKRTLRKKLN
jgi:DNA repair exonuclease SbcCD ATPase subunit